MLIAVGSIPVSGKLLRAPTKRLTPKTRLGLYMQQFEGREPEYHFARPDRDWRFDWAFPRLLIAFEYDGIFAARNGKANASHMSVSGVLRDIDKINDAQRRGWRVFRFTAKHVDDGRAFDMIDDLLGEHRHGR